MTSSQTVDQASGLGVGDAQAALLDLCRYSDEPIIRHGTERLERAEPNVDGAVVSFDRWRCDLASKTFVLTLAGPEGVFEVSGKFERQPGRKWRAEINRKRQT